MRSRLVGRACRRERGRRCERQRTCRCGGRLRWSSDSKSRPRRKTISSRTVLAGSSLCRTQAGQPATRTATRSDSFGFERWRQLNRRECNTRSCTAGSARRAVPVELSGSGLTFGGEPIVRVASTCFVPLMVRSTGVALKPPLGLRPPAIAHSRIPLRTLTTGSEGGRAPQGVRPTQRKGTPAPTDLLTVVSTIRADPHASNREGRPDRTCRALAFARCNAPAASVDLHGKGGGNGYRGTAPQRLF